MPDAAKRQELTPLRDWTVPPDEEARARGLPPDPPAPCSPGGVSEYGPASDAANDLNHGRAELRKQVANLHAAQDRSAATMPRMKDDPRYAEEACPNCGGDGDVERDGHWEPCEWCNGTAMVYTQEAIRLQMIERGELDADDA